MNPQPTRIDLGDVKSEHACRNREGWIFAAVVGLIGGGIAFYFDAPPFSWLLLLLTVAGWLALTTWWTPRHVLIRESGLEVQRWMRPPATLEFSAITAATWEFQVQTWAFMSWVKGCDVALADAHGRRLWLNPAHFEDPLTFFPRIWRLCVYPGHTALLERFAAGEEAGFREAAATMEHLRIGKQRWPWREVAKAEISPLEIIIHFKGRWRRRALKLRKMPFAFTFVEILRRQRVELSAFGGFVIER